MKLFVIIVFGFGLLFPAINIHGQEPHQILVSDLNNLCSSKDANDLLSCRFYIFGAMEGLSLGSAAEAEHSGPKKNFCVPEGVSQEEIVSVVKRLMRADLGRFPEDKNMPAVSFIAGVLSHNYSCTK